ncbi:uncharacterized protein [Hetaerina americana]|uniref:uncharacterized protein n=1 Tax=Hetaerina americana TaxID=62018 RepID=UPI003A7F392C
MVFRSDKVVISPWAQRELNIPNDVTLPEFIFRSLREKLSGMGDQPFVTDVVTGKSIPFSKLEEMSRSLAASLWQRGLRRGGLLFFTTYEAALVYVVQIACWMCGAAVRGCFPFETREEMERQMRESQPNIVMCDPETAPSILPILPSLDLPQVKILSLGGHVDGAESVEDLLENDNAPPLPDDIGISPKEDIASIFNTSGSTGFPKGCAHTHYNYIALLCNAKGLMGRGTLFTQMPNFAAGTMMCIVHCVWMGYSYLSLSKFSFDTFIGYLQKYKPGSVFLYGFVAKWFARIPEANSQNLDFIERLTMGGSYLDVETTKLLSQNFPQAKIVQLYGISEVLYVAGTECGEGLENISESPEKAMPVSGMKAVEIDGDYCLTAGKVLPMVEAKVIDVFNGSELGPLEKGELLVRNPYIIKGYTTPEPKDPYKCATDSDGWFHTGDYVCFDQAGNLYSIDRTAHVFKYFNHQVAPLEIEAVLSAHPSVLNSCVVPVPNTEATNLATAFVILKPGDQHQAVTADELATFVKERMVTHKQLHGGVKLVSQLPIRRCVMVDREALMKQA